MNRAPTLIIADPSVRRSLDILTNDRPHSVSFAVQEGIWGLPDAQAGTSLQIKKALEDGASMSQGLGDKFKAFLVLAQEECGYRMSVKQGLKPKEPTVIKLVRQPNLVL